jgi:hypothetical protein
VVVAAAQAGEQLGVELVAALGPGGGDRGGGLPEHVDDLPGPLLLGGMQLEDAFGVADQVSFMPTSGLCRPSRGRSLLVLLRRVEEGEAPRCIKWVWSGVAG